MIKYLYIIILIISTSNILLAQKNLKFYPLNYEYVIKYKFNQGEITKRPDSYIYHSEYGYAESIIQTGDTLSLEDLTKLETILSKGTFGLLDGLSKTYIPQIGIVFYGKNHDEIASISFGIDCGKLVFWKKGKGVVYIKEKINEKKALSILGELSKILNYTVKN